MAHDMIIIFLPLLLFARYQIYSGCQDFLQLGPQGALSMPPASTEAFCSGPCLVEMELVLHCVSDVMGSHCYLSGDSAREEES
jgi:hypothetical protein